MLQVSYLFHMLIYAVRVNICPKSTKKHIVTIENSFWHQYYAGGMQSKIKRMQSVQQSINAAKHAHYMNPIRCLLNSKSNYPMQILYLLESHLLLS